MVVVSNELPLEIVKVAGNKRLPTLPAVAQKLIELAQYEDVEFREVCDVVRSDPAVSGKILKTANSALFGFHSRIDSLEDAIPKLGTSMIRTLILSFHLAANSQGVSKYKDQYLKLWRSFLTQAVLAELIAEKTNADQASCFMAGLLQDIGTLAMIAEYGNDYVEHVLNQADLPEITNAEKRFFGFSHVEVSEEIIRNWNLGEEYVQAIKSHHDHFSPKDASDENRLALVLQAASIGAKLVSARHVSKRQLDELLNDWIQFLQLQFQIDAEQAQDVISEVNQRVEEYSLVFDFKIEDGEPVNRVIADAKELLQEIAIQQQLKAVNSQASSSQETRSEDDEMFRDCLTGLYNRRFLNQCLNQKIKSWVDKRKPIAMLFLDVDKFKSINDEYGHKTGDEAILHVATWLQETTRATDYVVRLGGDEFLVIMQLKESLCESIANRIVEEIPPLQLEDDKSLLMSLSLGCVHYQPKRRDKCDAGWLIDQADQLMYRVKKNGGSGLSMQTA